MASRTDSCSSAADTRDMSPDGAGACECLRSGGPGGRVNADAGGDGGTMSASPSASRSACGDPPLSPSPSPNVTDELDD